MMDEVRVMFVLELECVWGDMTFDLLTLFGFSNVRGVTSLNTSTDNCQLLEMEQSHCRTALKAHLM